MTETRSTCPYCGVGCGVVLRPGPDGVEVRGDPDHPANRGRLCSKGAALGETLGQSHRLLAPRLQGEDVPWDVALQEVAARFSSTLADHGPRAVGFYVSGQLLTEDYYVANKLMKGFLGSANIDTNSRLCMASSVAGHKRAFGSDTVPGTYEDLDQADVVVLVGSNLAWCHPVLYQRVRASGAKIIVIDPRRTASCDGSALHLPIAPGADAALFNRLLVEIVEQGAVDGAYLAHVDGFEAALAAARADRMETGLSPAEIRAFCAVWLSSEKVVTLYSQGVNQSTSGTDKVNAILNCHLATGRIGRPGMGPFSVTGQPNAMGGREVGGLANMLACHLDLENADHRDAVRTFWDAPFMPDAPGLKAVDMFRAVGRGEIKALWVMHTNPAVSMPEADLVKDAIAGCDLVVVSDITANTDTARLADILLPATAWAEKSGTVTNSDRTISRQRAVLPAPGSCRPDWAQLAEVGRRMGFDRAFDYQSPAEIFREYAALSGIAGRFGRDFDISGLQDLSDRDYDTLAPTRWPITKARRGGRFFADGAFFHKNGRAQMLAVTAKPPAVATSRGRAFRLNTGRVRDQWHTMTRTALSPRLSAHLPEPFLDIHPQDATRLAIKPADLVELRNDLGTAILRARLTDAQLPGQVFAPMHWTGETAPSARIDALVPGLCDPVSGQPESKGATVAVSRFQAQWYGFAVARSGFRPDCAYWALARTEAGYRAELAGNTMVEDWEAEARRLFDVEGATASTILDPGRGTARLAFERDGRMEAALFVASAPVAIMRDYLAGLPDARGAALLSGLRPVGQIDPGPVICSCFGVGVNTIVSAIESQALLSVEAVGAALQAGTNCGSCRSEIAAILSNQHQEEAAQ